MNKSFFNARKIAYSGILIAISVIFTRFLSFMIMGNTMRIGFGELPIILGSLLLGPIYGAIIGGLADIIGMLIFPKGAYFFGFTLSAMITGAIPGLILLLNKNRVNFKIMLIITTLNELIVSLGLNTLWLTMLMNKGFLVLLPSRIVESIIMAPVVAILVLLLYKSLNKSRLNI